MHIKIAKFCCGEYCTAYCSTPYAQFYGKMMSLPLINNEYMGVLKKYKCQNPVRDTNTEKVMSKSETSIKYIEQKIKWNSWYMKCDEKQGDNNKRKVKQ